VSKTKKENKRAKERESERTREQESERARERERISKIYSEMSVYKCKRDLCTL